MGQTVPQIFSTRHVCRISLTQHTTTRWHDAGQSPPQPLPLPMALRCLFWRNVPVHHIIGNAGHAWFVFFALGGVLCQFFYQCILKQNFANQGRRPTRPLPPVPAQCACLPHHGQCLARSVCFILHWRLLGAPKRNPWRKNNRESGGAQALRGRRSVEKQINQPKDSVGDGGVFEILIGVWSALQHVVLEWSWSDSQKGGSKGKTMTWHDHNKNHTQNTWVLQHQKRAHIINIQTLANQKIMKV